MFFPEGSVNHKKMTLSHVSVLNNETIDLIDRCKTDMALFIREFFPEHFYGAFSEMHEDFIRLMSLNPDGTRKNGQRVVIAAPRGNAKTTFWSLISCVHSVVYCYEPFTLLLGYSADEAQKKVRDIHDELLLSLIHI